MRNGPNIEIWGGLNHRVWDAIHRTSPSAEIHTDRCELFSGILFIFNVLGGLLDVSFNFLIWRKIENTVHFCNLMEKLSTFYPSLCLKKKLDHTRDSDVPSYLNKCCLVLKDLLLKIILHLCSFSSFPHQKLGVWITLLRTFCHTWMPDHYVLLNLCAKNGTEWHLMACYGKNSSREWSGQILCGEAWQNEEGGEPFNLLFFFFLNFLIIRASGPGHWVIGILLGTNETV